MKYFFSAFLLILFFSQCNLENRKPEFKKVQNVKLKSFSANNITITADAVIHNPNGVSIYLQNTEVDIFANEVKVSHISQTQNTEVTKKSDFIIPLKAKFKPNDLIKNDGSLVGLLSGVVNSLKDKTIELKYIGTATFKVAKFEFDIPIEYEESLELK